MKPRSQIRLIAGLGNPGLDTPPRGTMSALWWSTSWPRNPDRPGRSRENGMLSQQNVELCFCQALAFMNLSGYPLLAVAQFYKIEPQESLIVLDDFALPLGRLRLRGRGGPGGHNGLESVIVQFGTEEIPRLRIGIGAAPREGSVDYVLSRFFDEEKPIARVKRRSRGASFEMRN